MKEIVNNLRGKEEDFSWNRFFMLGMNEKNENKKVINLLLVIGKSAIWKKKECSEK